VLIGLENGPPIEMRAAQLSFGDGLIAEVSDLREDAGEATAQEPAAAAGWACRPSWYYVCWSSSTSET
jgi:hypothetical protein